MPRQKTPPATQYVSHQEYARIRGCSQASVSEAVRDGRIKTHSIMGKELINVEEANEDWLANSDPSQRRGPAAEQEMSVKKTKYPSFQESRSIKEAYAARIAKIEYEERLTKLVELDKINTINFDIARRVRNAILQVPSQINAECAVETDPHKCEIIISNALTEALENATKEDNKM